MGVLMIELMQHIDYMYEPFKTIDGKITYFVYLKDGDWKILQDEQLVLKTPHADFALDFLKDIGVDLEAFHSSLISHVATEAALYMTKIKKCEDLIGAETCRRSYDAWQEFGKKLQKAIQKETTSLKVVKC